MHEYAGRDRSSAGALGARAMRAPCEHTRYLPNGLIHTPMGTCDCPPKTSAQIRAENEAALLVLFHYAG